MRKNDVMEIHFVNLEQMAKHAIDVVKTGKTSIQPKNRILFSDIDGFRNFVTSQKLELLSVLATEQPASIYKLAKMVGRNFSAVWKDCTALKLMGFIKLTEIKNERKAIRPELVFPYRTIRVFLPRGSYQIQFSDVG